MVSSPSDGASPNRFEEFTEKPSDSEAPTVNDFDDATAAAIFDPKDGGEYYTTRANGVAKFQHRNIPKSILKSYIGSSLAGSVVVLSPKALFQSTSHHLVYVSTLLWKFM